MQRIRFAVAAGVIPRIAHIAVGRWCGRLVSALAIIQIGVLRLAGASKKDGE
jgi:hypothetical protein